MAAIVLIGLRLFRQYCVSITSASCSIRRLTMCPTSHSSTCAHSAAAVEHFCDAWIHNTASRATASMCHRDKGTAEMVPYTSH